MEPRKLVPNVVMYNYGEFHGDVVDNGIAKGTYRLAALPTGVGLPPPAPTEPDLSPEEVARYTALLAQWGPAFQAWFDEVRPEGPRPLQQLKRDVAHLVLVRKRASLGLDTLISPACPYDVLPTVMSMSESEHSGFMRLMYVRKRWLLDVGDVNKCIDDFDAGTSGNTISFTGPHGDQSKEGLQRLGAVEAPPGGYPGATPAQALEVIAAWVPSAKARLEGFYADAIAKLKDPAADSAAALFDNLLPMALPPRLAAAKAMVHVCETMQTRPDVLIPPTRVLMPVAVLPGSPDFEELHAHALRLNPSVPGCLDGSNPNLHRVLWKTVAVRPSMVVALGVDTLLNILNPE
jgi:hypothetical protein